MEILNFDKKCIIKIKDMGSWGHRCFENDAAGDWIVTLMKFPTWDFIEKTILKVNQNMHIGYEEEILAAIEVIAIKQGNRPKDYDEVEHNLEIVIDKLPKIPNTKLIEMSIKAVKEILKESHLREKIEYVGYENEWEVIMRDLIKRVKNC